MKQLMLLVGFLSFLDVVLSLGNSEQGHFTVNANYSAEITVLLLQVGLMFVLRLSVGQNGMVEHLSL